MLQEKFTALALKYTQNEIAVDELWNEIQTTYTDSQRYFHNLSHLEQLLKELIPLQPAIQDWDVLLFSVFYHDVAYDVVQYVLENDNEERSAAIAEKSLTSIGVPAEMIALCQQHILATKKHRLTDNNDTNLFTDADLSILGQPWSSYEVYMKNIRKEYAVYENSIFNIARIKVLNRFLQMERLFKTEHFFRLYEASARENIGHEIEILSHS